MSVQEQAVALVAAVDPTTVVALITKFPKTEKMDIRASWQSLDPHLGHRVPRAPAGRAEYLALKIERYEAEPQRDIATCTHYREQGLAALFAHDVCISSGSDPLGALRTALRLKGAHISCDLSILVKLMLELKDVETKLAETKSPQLALF